MNKASLKHSPHIFFPALLAQANFGTGIQPAAKDSMFSPPNTADFTVLLYLNNSISFIITILTGFAGLIFLFQFFMGALNWISAGGDQKKISEARDRITQGVIGLIVVVIAYAVVGVISSVVGIEILNPAQFIKDVFLTPAG